MTQKVVLAGKEINVKLTVLIRLGIFREDTKLLRSPYIVKTDVSEADLETFLNAVQGQKVTVTEENSENMKRLSEEFGYRGFAGYFGQAAAMSMIPTPVMVTMNAEIRQLKQRSDARDAEIAKLKETIGQLKDQLMSRPEFAVRLEEAQ